MPRLATPGMPRASFALGSQHDIRKRDSTYGIAVRYYSSLAISSHKPLSVKGVRVSLAVHLHRRGLLEDTLPSTRAGLAMKGTGRGLRA